MTDPRIPDDGPGSFDHLGLDSLSDGVRPTTDQWAAIGTTATHRRQRRAWLLTAAAMVVLIVGTAAVVLGRSTDDSVSISVGNLGGDSFVLPPDGSTDITAARVVEGSVLFYTDPQGRSWVLRQDLPPELIDDLSGLGPTTGTTMIGPGAFEVAPFGTVRITCSGYWVNGDTSGTVVSARGPATAVFRVGARGAWLSSNQQIDGPCLVDDPVLQAVAELRVVDRPAYEEFISGLPTEGVGPPVGVTVPASLPSTTTGPEEAPADRGSAVAQITAAVAAWSLPSADGSFTNLEDGTAKAAEYAEMFDTAAKQSGAAQAGDSSGNRNRLSSVRFVTPERASITISLTAVLPTGTYTFPQEGEAILEDGRWVITYRTVINTLGRACTPPGGYDGC